MLNLEELRADIEKFKNDREGLLLIIAALLVEIGDLRAQLTTTLVGCKCCGMGERARYMVEGMCLNCTEKTINFLRGRNRELRDRLREA